MYSSLKTIYTILLSALISCAREREDKSKVCSIIKSKRTFVRFPIPGRTILCPVTYCDFSYCVHILLFQEVISYCWIFVCQRELRAKSTRCSLLQQIGSKMKLLQQIFQDLHPDKDENASG